MSSRAEWKKLYSSDGEMIKDNLQWMYDNVTQKDYQEGKGWYASANSFSFYLSNKYGVSQIKTSGIIAAFSPLKEWNLNKRMAEEFIESGGTFYRHTASQGGKAISIYNSNDDKGYIESSLGGQKTINFFNNIYNPKDENYVTIDRHHLYICLKEDVQTCTNKQYHLIKKNTIEFSKSVNLKPCEVQAMLWVTWKRLKKEWNGKEKSNCKRKEQWYNDRKHVLVNDKVSPKKQEQMVEACIAG